MTIEAVILQPTLLGLAQILILAELFKTTQEPLAQLPEIFLAIQDKQAEPFIILIPLAILMVILLAIMLIMKAEPFTMIQPLAISQAILSVIVQSVMAEQFII